MWALILLLLSFYETQEHLTGIEGKYDEFQMLRFGGILILYKCP